MKKIKNKKNSESQFLSEWMKEEGVTFKTIDMEVLISRLIFMGITPKEAIECIIKSGYFEYFDSDKRELFDKVDEFINGRFYEVKSDGGYFFFQEIENFVEAYFKVKEELENGKSHRI